MNKSRRKALQFVIDTLSTIDLQSISDEEQEAFNNMPEGLQSSERGERTQEIAEQLEEASNTLSELIDTLNSCLE